MRDLKPTVSTSTARVRMDGVHTSFLIEAHFSWREDERAARMT